MQTNQPILDLQSVLNNPGNVHVDVPAKPQNSFTGEMVPAAPKTITEAGLHKNDLFPLILKFLFLYGNQSGSRIADQLKLHFSLLEPVLVSLKSDLLISHKGISRQGDYDFELTPKGVDQAKLHLGRSSYCGSAPVSIADYRQAVMEQSIKHCKPTYKDVKNAMKDLMVSDVTISQIGQAINSGRSMFLFGSPGNGKTSIAIRAIRAVSEIIWIPRALTVGGEVIRLYDPAVHEEVPVEANKGYTRDREIDERWVRIKRPVVVVGGELELKHLDATLNPVTGIIEAPIHLKSSCGCLVVDDFGRQQISPTELLNRWIVPMESGSDFINLPSGRQISLPFEQLLIFSTNLEPSKLCDEAFMRRIPYKVEVFDPSEKQFRELFDIKSKDMGFRMETGAIDRLIEYHYKRVGRPFRFSHVTDLLNQAKDFCEFHRQPLAFTKDIAELSVLNYFSGSREQVSV